MADLVAGVQPYRTLKWRLLKTLELTLACRFVAATLRHSLRRSALEPATVDSATGNGAIGRAPRRTLQIDTGTVARRRMRRGTHPIRKETVRRKRRSRVHATDRRNREQRWYNRRGHSVLTPPLA